MNTTPHTPTPGTEPTPPPAEPTPPPAEPTTPPLAEAPVLPASVAAQRRRVRPWHIAAGVVVVLGALALGATVALVLSLGAPAPISRADMMHRYAELAPLDRTSTPDKIDDTANKACRALAEGHSTDEIITVATRTYGSRATEVIHLLVQYKCPDRLGDFK